MLSNAGFYCIGSSHAFCGADSDLGIIERMPSTACPVSCDSCFRACATCISSGPPVMSGSFTHTFNTPGDFYLRSTSSPTMRLQVHVVDCQFCHVMTGYAGDNPESLSIAISSQAPGDYALTFQTYAFLGQSCADLLPGAACLMIAFFLPLLHSQSMVFERCPLAPPPPSCRCGDGPCRPDPDHHRPRRADRAAGTD